MKTKEGRNKQRYNTTMSRKKLPTIKRRIQFYTTLIIQINANIFCRFIELEPKMRLIKLIKVFQLKVKIILYVIFIVTFFVVGLVHKNNKLENTENYIIL